MSSYNGVVLVLSLISINISPSSPWLAQCAGFKALALFRDRPVLHSLLNVLSASLSGFVVWRNCSSRGFYSNLALILGVQASFATAFHESLS